MSPGYLKRFLILTQVTLVFVFLVILAGSVVRASGSGMGCPDWPKCFGKLIPPTDVSELPANYKELYSGEHHAVADFNALNTWTEYINRLFGATLGLLAFLQFVFSFRFLGRGKIIFILSFIELFLIGFEAWLGAKVVSSNLAPIKITTHMVVSLLILSVAMVIIHRVNGMRGHSIIESFERKLKNVLLVVLFFSAIQIILGTQVREQVDVLLKNFDDIFRMQVVENLGISFKIHRSFSILILLVNGWLIYQLVKKAADGRTKNISKLLAGVLFVEVLAGVVLSRLALPAFVQPVHLVLACIMYALQFWLLLKMIRK